MTNIKSVYVLVIVLGIVMIIAGIYVAFFEQEVDILLLVIAHIAIVMGAFIIKVTCFICCLKKKSGTQGCEDK